MEATARKLELPMAKLVVTVDQARQHLGGIDSARARCSVRDGRIARAAASVLLRRGRRLHLGLGAPGLTL